MSDRLKFSAQQNENLPVLSDSLAVFAQTAFSNLNIQIFSNTVNFLNMRTPKKFVLITLKFELCGSTIE